MFRILVVDDEASLRSMLHELLSEAGYSVDTADSGEQALKLLETKEYHVVLTDLRMSGMHGIELIRRIREIRGEVEVVVMTSYASAETAIEALRLGAYDYLIKPFENLDAVLSLVKRTLDKVKLVIENRRLVEDLRRKNEELEKLNHAIRELAVRDGLTGLYNYRYLHDVLQAEVARSHRHRRNICVMMIDVDHFKCYNDHHGHIKGDEVLRTLAHILGERARKTDTVARYGGEEFAVVLPETRRDFAMNVGEEFRRLVEEYPFPETETQPLGRMTISLGLAEYPTDADHFQALIERADQALYRAKAAGRNRVCWFGAAPSASVPTMKEER